MTKKWFKPSKHTGWQKNLPASTRRARLLRSTSKGWKPSTRYRVAGRRALALSNVTQDNPTKVAARSDAKHFFRKLKKEGDKK